MNRKEETKEQVSETGDIVLYRTPSTERAQTELDMVDRFGFSMEGWKVFWAEGKGDRIREFVVFNPSGEPMHMSDRISSVMQYIDITRVNLRNGEVVI